MEGFIPAKVFALGYRDSANDFMEKAPKHRWKAEKLFTTI
jgi:hypothetical protein